MSRKIILLTEGFTNPHVAKTARNVIAYIPEEVTAVLDKFQKGKYAEELLNVGKDIPVIGSLDEASDADTLLIGVATPGGKIPSSYKMIILEAISRKMNIVSGLHQFLCDDEDISNSARLNNVEIIDIRKNTHREVAHRKNINESCLRIQTVGNDCSLGKMIVSIELHKELKRRGYSCNFAATGQTSIFIEGKGIPIDAVVGDYINGAAEKLVLQNQDADFLMIEGQGSLVHPRYSSVTLGLLHGAVPHGLIMCYEMGRENIVNMEGVKIPPMEKVLELYDKAANIMYPCKIIGFGLNSRKHSLAEAEKEIAKMKEKYGLPICDVVRHGPGELVEAVLSLKKEVHPFFEFESASINKKEPSI